MGVVHHRHQPWLVTTITSFVFLFFFASAFLLCEGRIVGNGLSSSGPIPAGRLLLQKRLTGPGSFPPTCRSKCGPCFPCIPVHVPIQHRMSIPLEYYPEAWRCKCGNNLFMP